MGSIEPDDADSFSFFLGLKKSTVGKGHRNSRDGQWFDKIPP
jgi:hypothetical protein